MGYMGVLLKRPKLYSIYLRGTITLTVLSHERNRIKIAQPGRTEELGTTGRALAFEV